MRASEAVNPMNETSVNLTLMVGSCLSAVAALLHIGIIIGGATWYRFFGAGERMARAADAGRAYPAVVTSFIAAVLVLWCVYAASGAGLLAPLPLLKLALAVITGIYLLRGLAVVPLFTVARSRSTPFLMWSSVICLGYGSIHLVGLVQVWNRL